MYVMSFFFAINADGVAGCGRVETLNFISSKKKYMT